MNITVFAFKTWNRSEPGEVVYHGDNGEKANAAGLESFKKGFVRAGKTTNPPLVPINPPATLETASEKPQPAKTKPEKTK